MRDLRDTVSEQADIIQRFKTELNEADHMDIHVLKSDPSVPITTVLSGLAEMLGIEGHEQSDVLSAFKIPGKQGVPHHLLVKFVAIKAA